MTRVMWAAGVAGLFASACFVPPGEACNEPGIQCLPDGGRAGGTSGGMGGGTAGGTSGGSSGGTAGGSSGGVGGGGASTGGGSSGGIAGGSSGGIGGGGASTGGGSSGGGAGGSSGGVAGGGASTGGGSSGGGASTGGGSSGGGASTGGGSSGGFAGGGAGGGGGMAGGGAGAGVGGGLAGGAAGGFAGGGAGGGIAPGPGESCANAVALSVPAVVMGSTAGSVSNHEFTTGGGCRRTGPGTPDQAWAITVPGQRSIAVTLTPQNWDAVINLVTDPSLCGAPANPGRSCLASADDPERVTYFNPSPGPVTVYLVVAGFSANARGAYTLSVDFVEGERCEAPIVFDAGVPLVGQGLSGFANDYTTPGSGCANRVFGPDRVYQTTVPAQSALSVQVAPINADTNISFAVNAPTCAARQCTGTPADTVGFGAVDRGSFLNTASVPVDVWIVVDSSSVGANASFTLTSAVGPLPPPGDTCGTATVVGPNQVLPNESLAGMLDTASFGQGCDFRPGPDRVYAVDVPPFTTQFATVLPITPGFDPTLSVSDALTSCSASQCIAAASPGPGGRTIAFTNQSLVTRRYYLTVDAFVPMGGQTSFILSTSNGSLFDGGIDGGGFVDAGVADGGGTGGGGPGPGETCLMPEPLIVGAPVLVPLGSSTNDTSSTSASCNFGPGPDRMYSVTIPSGQRLTVTASPQAPFDLTLSSSSNTAWCAMGLCTQSVQSTGIGGTETLIVDNPLAAATTVVITIDSLTPMAGQVGLFASLTPLVGQPGDTCQAPVLVMPPQTIIGLTTQGLTRDYMLTGGLCRGPMGPEAVFSVTVPAFQTLSVTVTSMNDAVVNVLTGPAATCGFQGCLAGADMTVSGPESVTWFNGTGAAQTVFVAVGRFGMTPPPMQYDVSFSIVP
ncbi:MAG: hypothetical protein SFW67_22800 [Myxococcaceae bacterium]|nr:hypothetical protein [Myxococcaceae bacterium]